jgi:hypothetical protein
MFSTDKTRIGNTKHCDSARPPSVCVGWASGGGLHVDVGDVGCGICVVTGWGHTHAWPRDVIHLFIVMGADQNPDGLQDSYGPAQPLRPQEPLHPSATNHCPQVSVFHTLPDALYFQLRRG